MSDLRDEDAVEDLMKGIATVFGNAPELEADINRKKPEGTLIVSGSAAGRVRACGIRPDIIVTDLDGDLKPQTDFSAEGCLTLILAHGDNADLLRTAAPLFRGPVILTTQGMPVGPVMNFGGFTDGDRAVCLAREFGAKIIHLCGFDFENPMPKEGSDPAVKLRKLAWAKRIIFDMERDSADIITPGCSHHFVRYRVFCMGVC